MKKYAQFQPTPFDPKGLALDKQHQVANTILIDLYDGILMHTCDGMMDSLRGHMTIGQ